MKRLMGWDFSAIRLWEHGVGRALQMWVKTKRFFYVVATLAWAGIAASSLAQEATITDPNLSAAILEALQKQAGPLTGQDLLSLTNLNAGSRSIRSVQGLQEAQNLVSLDLKSNNLSKVTFENGLAKLSFLDLSFNRLISLN